MAANFMYPVSPQKFPFLAPLMSYIIILRTATLHSKLIQSCKYYYAKNPVIVVRYIYFRNKEIFLKGEEWANNKTLYVDVNKIFCKFWIVSSIYFKYANL